MSKEKSSGGLGFCSVLTLVFITLKLTDNIDWSWWWVLSPLWIPACLVVFVAMLAVVMGVVHHGR